MKRWRMVLLCLFLLLVIPLRTRAQPTAFAPRFIVTAYTPNSIMGAKPDAEIVAQAGQDGVIIVQTTMLKAGRLPGLRGEALRQGLRQQIWLYELPQAPGGWMSFYSYVSARENWWLHNPENSLVKTDRVHERNDRAGLLDFRRADVRDYLVNHLMGWIDGYGLDGYFQDLSCSIVKTSYGWLRPPTLSQKATYSDGCASFIEQLRARLGTRQVWHNAYASRYRSSPRSDGYNYDEVVTSGAKRVVDASDGFMIEGVYHAPWMCANEMRGEYIWEDQLRIVEAKAALGKRVIVYSGTKLGGLTPTPKVCTSTQPGTPEEREARWKMFAFGAYLLTAQQGDYFTWYMNGPVRNQSLMSIVTGNPLGPRTKLSSGLWQRTFERVVVRVNLSSTATRGGLGPQRAAITGKP